MRNIITKLGVFLPIKKNFKIFPPKKILFFRTGGIGDVIMTTPLLREVKKFTNAEIHYLTGEHSLQVLKNNPYVDKIITFDEKIMFKKDFKRLLILRSKIKKQKYDSVFILDKSYLANLFFYSTNIKVRIGFDRSGEGFPNTHNIIYDQKTHDINAYLKLAEFLGIKSRNYRPEILLTKKELQFANNFYKKNKIKKSIVIAPGGANNPGQKIELKIWPKEKYRALVKILIKKFDVIIVGGLSDKEISSYIAQNLKAHNLTGKTTLHQTAAIMKKAKLVICNDSGPMHLASCVNKKILSLFFITNPKVLAPLHKESKYLWKEKKACYDIYGNTDNCEGNENGKVSVEEVFIKVKKMLNVT